MTAIQRSRVISDQNDIDDNSIWSSPWSICYMPVYLTRTCLLLSSLRMTSHFSVVNSPADKFCLSCPPLIHLVPDHTMAIRYWLIHLLPAADAMLQFNSENCLANRGPRFMRQFSDLIYLPNGETRSVSQLLSISYNHFRDQYNL
jgi:hypothetical protein